MKIQKSMVVEHWRAFTVLSLLLKRERENAIKVMLCACRQYSQILRVFFRLQKLSSHRWLPIMQTINSVGKVTIVSKSHDSTWRLKLSQIKSYFYQDDISK